MTVSSLLSSPACPSLDIWRMSMPGAPHRPSGITRFAVVKCSTLSPPRLLRVAFSSNMYVDSIGCSLIPVLFDGGTFRIRTIWYPSLLMDYSPAFTFAHELLIINTANSLVMELQVAPESRTTGTSMSPKEVARLRHILMDADVLRFRKVASLR